MGALATDNFNRANANPIGGNWTTVTSLSAFQIVSNAATPSNLNLDAGSYYNAITWPNDQYSQAVITVTDILTDGSGPGVMVRASASALTAYRVVVTKASPGNNVSLQKWVSGAFSVIWNRAPGFSDGQTLRLEAQGTTLRVFIDGVQVGADATDSSIASGNAGISYSSTATAATIDNWEGGDFTSAVPFNPQRTVQGRDPGETWWTQGDRRNAVFVALAANDLLTPLLVAEHVPQVRHASAYIDRRAVPWQPPRLADPSMLVPPAMPLPPAARTVQTRDPGEVQWLQRPGRDPSLLTTALLENELLGGADTGQRYRTAATHAARWWMPQQPKRDAYTPGLLDTALLEGALLGGADLARRWQHAAVYVDRREYPQQRPYVSDPLLLTMALLEGALLGLGDVLRRYQLVAATHDDRRLVPQQRPNVSDPLLLSPPAFDPLTVAAGVGGDIWRRANTPATQYDRRQTTWQPPRVVLYFDAGPGIPPLTLAWGAGGSIWHRYNQPAELRTPWAPRATPPLFISAVPTGPVAIARYTVDGQLRATFLTDERTTGGTTDGRLTGQDMDGSATAGATDSRTTPSGEIT